MSIDVEGMLKAAVEANASDIHLSSGTPPMVRVGGELLSLRNWNPLDPEDVQTVFEHMVPDPMARERFWADLELDFAYTVPGLTRFRGNVCLERGNLKLSLRALPLKVPSMEELDLPPVIRHLATQPKGLVLVCGPTGSGKSTTLAAMIQHINLYHKRVIVTVEDPIEYIHPDEKSLISQREVGFDTRNLRSALRYALRQDPDVILVGEMRDLETIALAVTAAETGHLVLSTLHANSAVEAVDRIVDAFPPSQQNQIRMQISMSLAGIVYQVLLSRTGGKGRIAACEVLVGTLAIRNLVRLGKTYQIPTYLQTGKDVGMQTLEQAVEDLKRRRLVDPDVAVDIANPFQDDMLDGSPQVSSLLDQDAPFGRPRR